MALDNAWNMYIFREGRTALRGADLTRELAEGLRQLPDHDEVNRRTELLDLLLRAGELECALADSQSPQAELGAALTDELAAALVAGSWPNCSGLAEVASRIEAPETVHVAPPEGFAYYALHPLDFVDLVRERPETGRRCAVVGIRSIGTTLSAVVKAALRLKGLRAERITVRPTGHPYDRRTQFSGAQLRWASAMQSQEADFLVVDEGPGMSGSSFLSVGEALPAAGVAREKIVFLGSREPDPKSLTTPNAAERWRSFRAHYTRPTRHHPKEAKRYVAGGIWRSRVFASEEEWPASWLQMERLKFLSADGERLYRFEGFGRFGKEVRNRSIRVAEAGFGPMPLGREEGFGVYPMLRGRSLSAADGTPAVLNRIAQYCAFRAQAFRVRTAEAGELNRMLRFNVLQEFGIELPDPEIRLAIEIPVICDGRILPHKWLESSAGAMKVDAATHGDDHFFPGPADIAWDLAGVVVEWKLDGGQQRFFVDAYSAASGDEVEARLPAYLLAYSVFRMAYSKMAAASMRGSSEELRLSRDYSRYREQAAEYLARTVAVPDGQIAGEQTQEHFERAGSI